MARDDGGTFLTGVTGSGAAGANPNEELKITEEDVISHDLWTWKAHEDGINWVTYIPELHMVATCAFDYNVFVWDAETVKDTVNRKTAYKGSLLLGNKVLPPETNFEDLDNETKWYKNQWNISIDKMTRYREEMEKARQMLEEVSMIDYNTLRATGAKKKGSVVEEEAGRPIG